MTYTKDLVKFLSEDNQTEASILVEKMVNEKVAKIIVETRKEVSDKLGTK